MKKNINKLMGLHASQKILLALTQKGLSREKAYTIVQKASMDTWTNCISFKDSLLKITECKEYLEEKEIENIINNLDYKKNVDLIFDRVFK